MLREPVASAPAGGGIHRSGNRQSFRNIVQGDGKGDAHAKLEVVAGRDIGGDPFRKVMQADPQRQKNSGAA